MSRPRIVILGGGVGSVTTAIKLSGPGWQERFASITLLQQGWRLGGKGASGRGRDRRIEEHGLHIWFGFYENAFRMLRRCHDELDALAAGSPKLPRWPLAFPDMEASFRACERISLTDHDRSGWSLWDTDFLPFDEDRPWLEPDAGTATGADEPTGALYAARCLELATDGAASLLGGGVAETLLGAGTRTLLAQASGALRALAAAASAGGPVEPAIAEAALCAVQLAADEMRAAFGPVVRHLAAARRAWYLVDLLLATTRGLLGDGLIAARSFDSVDGVEFRDWLRAHGAQAETVECALVRTLVYDLPFAYGGGDPRRPACSAATALRGLLRVFFGFRGAVMWKMNAGMGDVVFAPMYELLVKRGVEVRFFHRVEAVRARGDTVTEIEIDVQAELRPGVGPREFLMEERALWPSDPAAVLCTPAPDPRVYESWLAGREAARVQTVTLRYGARGTHGFDLVVYGMSIATVPLVAPDLIDESPAWAEACAQVQTVATQALQLWLRRPAPALADVPDGVVVGGFVEPFDTWADMAQLSEQEGVGAATVAYFCNALCESGPPPPRGRAEQWLAEQDALVRANALRFLRRDVGALWPRAVDPVTGSLDWELLVAPDGAAGEARLDAQYVRANVEPTERYVLSLPGTSGVRIRPDATGFRNLYAAGDWTACRLDAGCVEAAVISGMLAANAIHRVHGDPGQVEEIVGMQGP